MHRDAAQRIVNRASRIDSTHAVNNASVKLNKSHRKQNNDNSNNNKMFPCAIYEWKSCEIVMDECRKLIEK